MHNSRAKAVGGINNNMNNTMKDLDRAQDKLQIYGAALVSTKVEGSRLASWINGVR